MKLENVLERLNSFEKNSFLKIIDGILTAKPKNAAVVDKLLSDSSRDLKNMDNINVAKVFNLVEEEFLDYTKSQLVDTESQLDILIDIISRDGSCIMKQEWFARLYENELLNLDKKLKAFQDSIENEKSEIDPQRLRDYKIYKSCVYTAYYNDEVNNQDKKITADEQSILLTLSTQLGLSQEEVKLINYLIIPVRKLDIDTVINELKVAGVIFHSKKNNVIYVADDVVRILNKARGKEVNDKFFRRILRLLREPQINQICRAHNIGWHNPVPEKIKEIINIGVSFSHVLSYEIYKDGTNVTEKKQFINDLWDKGLKIASPLRGVTLEEKISNIIKYFEDIDRDDKIGISIDGYEKLLIEMGEVLPTLNQLIKSEFGLQDDNTLRAKYLLSYNIKPRDILEVTTESDLEIFSKVKEIKTRGDLIINILDAYKDSANLYLENYENIGFRNLSILKENGILIKESEIGVKFEELTKNIFVNLGFNVDETLRKQLNTNKDLTDIVLNLGNNDLILVECKTSKESSYNKFSSVSRQLKAYSNLAKINNYKVIKSLLVAPDFSADFVKDCGLDYELNLSLITASSLLKIMNCFKTSKHKEFPYNLLMRDVLIQEDRVLAAMEK
jgi:hypothetical protein